MEYIIYSLVTSEAGSVYRAVRTESLSTFTLILGSKGLTKQIANTFSEFVLSAHLKDHTKN